MMILLNIDLSLEFTTQEEADEFVEELNKLTKERCIGADISCREE